MSAISKLSDVLLPGDHYQDFASLVAGTEKNSISELVQDFFKELNGDSQTATKLLGITAKYYNDAARSPGSEDVAKKIDMINRMVTGNVMEIYQTNSEKNTFKGTLFEIVNAVTEKPETLARPHRTGRYGLHTGENFGKLIKLFSDKDAGKFMGELLNESTIKDLGKINNVLKSFIDVYNVVSDNCWTVEFYEKRLEKKYGLNSELRDNFVNFFNNLNIDNYVKAEKELKTRIESRAWLMTFTFQSMVRYDDVNEAIDIDSKKLNVFKEKMPFFVKKKTDCNHYKKFGFAFNSRHFQLFVKLCEMFELNEEKVFLAFENIHIGNMAYSAGRDLASNCKNYPSMTRLRDQFASEIIKYILNKYGEEAAILKDYKFS